MSPDAFLIVVAELAVGIIGFAGIIAAIQRRGLSTLPGLHRVWLQVLLGAEAAAIVFALGPFVFAAANVPPETIWKIGSFGMLLWYVAVGSLRKRQSTKLGSPVPIPFVNFTWVVAICILQSYNIIAGGKAWPYLIAVFGLVANGFVAFVLLLMSPVESNEEST